MATLRVNILSNYAGQIWMAAMAVAFLPQYIRILGLESFALIGLMLSLQSISQLFDLGMGGAINRELSRRSHDKESVDHVSDLVRTFEWAIWPLTVLLGALVWAGSGAMAAHWLHPDQIDRTEMAGQIAIMGAAVALLWPSGFYANCLSGLEQQPALNLVNAVFATLRGAGVLVVLTSISPTLEAFLWWYVAMGACQSIAMAAMTWNKLAPRTRRPRFVAADLHASGRFAGGLFAIGTLSLLVLQVDRLAIATLRPLAELGYYTLALSVAAGMGRMVQPMFNALYPRFSRLVAAHNDRAVAELYHLASQCVAVVVAAVSLVLIVFSKDVVFMWTGDGELASKVALPMAILVAGTALNGLLNLPYALQLAHGWTRLGVYSNALALLLGLPYCIYATAHFGIAGAASLWLVVNAGFVLIAIPMMHARLLRGEAGVFFRKDVLPPFLAAVAVCLVARWLFPVLDRDIPGLMLLAVISAAALGASAFSSPYARALCIAALAPKPK